MSGVANAVRGEAQLLIGGVARVLRPSFAALVAAEQELGPLFAMVERAAAGSLSLQELATLFFHCLEDKGALTRESVGEAIVETGIAAATPVLRALLAQILQGR